MVPAFWVQIVTKLIDMKKLSAEFLTYQELKNQYGRKEMNNLIGLNRFKEEVKIHGLKSIVKDVEDYFNAPSVDWQADC